MPRYNNVGKNLSAGVHAGRSHECNIGDCDKVSYGNGGKVAHARAHVRRGEAIELIKIRPGGSDSRVFVTVGDDERIDKFKAMGFWEDS